MFGLKKLFTRVKEIPSLQLSASDDNVEQLFSPTISDQTRKEYNAQRPIGSRNTACSAPLKNMYFTRTGAVHACCHNRDYVLGTYPQDTIQKIWHGEKAKELRNRMACYNMSAGCQICQNDLERGSFSEVKASHFDMLPEAGPLPIMMEFELDITCNLECTMCSGEFSSLIRKNREDRLPHQTPYDAEFVTQLKPFLTNLKEARFSGGEPFLIPIYFPIWKALSEANPDCLISVQTNGTVLNNKVKETLAQGRFEIGVSLDSLTKETFEAIRKGVRFETVMENVNYFSEYCATTSTPFRLSMCVMRNNWHEMPNYVNHCNSLGAYASFHRVSTPLDQSLWNLGSVELFQIHTQLAQAGTVPAETQVAKDNLRHYQTYIGLILEWAEAQQQREIDAISWEKLDTEEAVSLFKSVICDGVKDSTDPFKAQIPEILDDLFNQLPSNNVRQAVLELKNQNRGVIIQRLRLKTIEEMVKELKSIYPSLFK